MDLREIKNISVKMIENFVNTIGLDGEYYGTTCNCQMSWGKPKLDAEGEFITPESDRLINLVNRSPIDENTKRRIISRGLILVNSKYKFEEMEANLFVTLIHEMIHSNRSLMICDAVRNDTNENAYNYENSSFNQNTFDFDFSYVDASQDLLKGNINDSRNTIDMFNQKTDEELDIMEFESGKRDKQMTNQQIIDESLVELMAVLSYKLYTDQGNDIDTNIWNSIVEISNHYEGTDVGAMCKIILKHQDFELFYWMLDPIEYSLENIHYDFFKDYTKNDQELLKELYSADELDIDEILCIDKSSNMKR